jgi:hypothetical protein
MTGFSPVESDRRGSDPILHKLSLNSFPIHI